MGYECNQTGDFNSFEPRMPFSLTHNQSISQSTNQSINHSIYTYVYILYILYIYKYVYIYINMYKYKYIYSFKYFYIFVYLHFERHLYIYINNWISTIISNEKLQPYRCEKSTDQLSEDCPLIAFT